MLYGAREISQNRGPPTENWQLTQSASGDSQPRVNDAVAFCTAIRISWARRVAARSTAIKQLDDQELDRLQAAVLAEQRRRGRNSAVSIQTPVEPRTEVVAVHLTLESLTPGRAAGSNKFGGFRCRSAGHEAHVDKFSLASRKNPAHKFKYFASTRAN